jgi:hypothetical protein
MKDTYDSDECMWCEEKVFARLVIAENGLFILACLKHLQQFLRLFKDGG